MPSMQYTRLNSVYWSTVTLHKPGVLLCCFINNQVRLRLRTEMEIGEDAWMQPFVTIEISCPWWNRLNDHKTFFSNKCVQFHDPIHTHVYERIILCNYFFLSNSGQALKPRQTVYCCSIQTNSLNWFALLLLSSTCCQQKYVIWRSKHRGFNNRYGSIAARVSVCFWELLYHLSSRCCLDYVLLYVWNHNYSIMLWYCSTYTVYFSYNIIWMPRNCRGDSQHV